MEGSLLTLRGSSKTIVLFAASNRLELFGGGALSHSESLDIAPSLIKDMEIVDKKNLSSTINAWLLRLRVPVSDLVMLLSERSYFFKDSLVSTPEEIEKEKQDFVDTVPFETVIAKHYATASGFRIIAVNGEFVRLLSDAFRPHDIVVVAVVPSFLVEGHSGKQSLDADMGKYVMAHVEKLKSLSLVPPDIHPHAPSTKEVAVFAKKNQRFVVLLGVFLVLVIILGILLVVLPS